MFFTELYSVQTVDKIGKSRGISFLKKTKIINDYLTNLKLTAG